MSIINIEEWITYCKEWESKIGAFTELNFAVPEPSAESGHSRTAGQELPHEAKALLSGMPYAVKDNIAVKGFLLSCGSKHLESFRSPYSASAVDKLNDLGAHFIGKTNLDEFGMSSSTDTSGIKKTNNPWDVSRVAGGSSGGSAAAVAAGMVPFALGSDTSGSVRQPASFCGVVELKPTYGAVSRYGLAAYGSSLEGIGILADSTARTRAVFAAIRGKDPMDGSSRDAPKNAPPLFNPDKKPQNGTIGFLSAQTIVSALGTEAETMEKGILDSYERTKENFSALGYKCIETDIPGLEYAAPACFTIAAAEGSSNMARFDGIRFGKQPPYAENHDELIDKTRNMGFGEEVKLRILLGTYALRSEYQERYYLRALKIQSGIKAGLEGLLGNYDTLNLPPLDAILLPVYPCRAFDRSSLAPSSFTRKVYGVFNCIANLAGLPSVSFPVNIKEGLPEGMQLMGRSFSEGMLFDMAEAYETAHPFPHPEGFKAFWQ